MNGRVEVIREGFRVVVTPAGQKVAWLVSSPFQRIRVGEDEAVDKAIKSIEGLLGVGDTAKEVLEQLRKSCY